jgi:hypothetical protein
MCVVQKKRKVGDIGYKKDKEYLLKRPTSEFKVRLTTLVVLLASE